MVDQTQLTDWRSQSIRRALIDWEQLPPARAQLPFESAQKIIEQFDHSESHDTLRAIELINNEQIIVLSRNVLSRQVQNVAVAQVAPSQAIIHPTPPSTLLEATPTALETARNTS
jgi:hypothetical protein